MLFKSYKKNRNIIQERPTIFGGVSEIFINSINARRCEFVLDHAFSVPEKEQVFVRIDFCDSKIFLSPCFFHWTRFYLEFSFVIDIIRYIM